ncbi:MAG: hypothetical protein QOK04_1234, partial [Solirubrobacteraceae bacterium]|nr:hypothetical protein [Solirubrobacteraceae bacterium]
DMAHYSLGGHWLLHHALGGPIDAGPIASGRDYSGSEVGLLASGTRMGGELSLAWLASLTGKVTYALYMPLTAAFQICLLCAVGALAQLATPRRAAAALAMALFAISPMATFGITQQLLPQTYGLALLVALAALTLRREVVAVGPRAVLVVPAATLLAALAIVYSELLPLLAAGAGIWIAIGLVRRDFRARALGPVAFAIVGMALVLINTYAVDGFSYLQNQVSSGGSPSNPAAPLFGYALVPSALPGALGFTSLPPGIAGDALARTIGVAAAALVVIATVAVRGVLRGQAPSVFVLLMLVMGVVFVRRGADFGAFKLTMYAQPFLAAAVAGAVVRLRRPGALAAAGAAVLAFGVIAVDVQHGYVDASRDAGDVPGASSAQFLPRLERFARTSGGPIVSTASILPTYDLEDLAAGPTPLQFTGRDFAAKNVLRYRPARLALAKVTPRHSRLIDLGRGVRAQFSTNDAVTVALRDPACHAALETPRMTVLSRSTLTAGAPLEIVPCKQVRDVLAFTETSRSESFYGAINFQRVALYRLEGDPAFPGRTFSGAGRYLATQVLGMRPGSRLVVSLSRSNIAGDKALAGAVVAGAQERALPLIGRGSARVAAPVVAPQEIDGAEYMALDLGRDARVTRTRRTGVPGAYRATTVLDSRALSAHLRDVSLLSPAEDSARTRPASISTFPADLGNPGLFYSGIYEDGWIAEAAYAELAMPARSRLIVAGETYPAAFGRRAAPLRVLVDGREVARRTPGPGAFDLSLPATQSPGVHRVELALGHAPRLPAPDGRPATLHLRFFGYARAAR